MDTQEMFRLLHRLEALLEEEKTSLSPCFQGELYEAYCGVLDQESEMLIQLRKRLTHMSDSGF